MQEVLLDYGDSHLRVGLPDAATIVRYGETYVDPPEIDPVEATLRAIRNPVGLPPLHTFGGPHKKIVIGFPDRVKGGAQSNSHRKTSIPLVIKELLSAGCVMENITLLCAIGLHRKNTLEEWLQYLGKDIVDAFWPDRLINHDAEAADLCEFGLDGMENVIQCNRMVAEADLTVMIGHCSGNPYGGYSGGHKMVATGVTGWRSIASHHCPATMHRDDWLGASPRSHMRLQFRSIAEAMEASIGKKFFGIDAVLGQKSQILAVQAGELREMEKSLWPLADSRTNIHLQDTERADILVMGLPRNFHYGPGMGSNPILMSLAIGGQLSRCWNAFNEGGVVIASAICDGWFNKDWFASYEETYEKLQHYKTAAEFLSSQEAYDLATDKTYRERYSNDYIYHPFHAMSMVSGGSIPPDRCSAVFIVGAKEPRYALGMRFTPVDTFDEAMERAKKLVGRSPKVLCTPECFSGGVGVHLHTAGQ